jgi:hypothetical protein
VSVFGVPIFAGDEPGWTPYLSVFGDMQNFAGYRLAVRARHFIRLWLGPWYLAALVPMALIPLDLFIGVWTRSRAEARGAGGFLAFAVLGAGWLPGMAVDWRALDQP